MSDAKQERTPANQNPWYVLMTLYGEQTGEEIDNALHDKNREAWNSWAGFVLPESIRDGCSAGGVALPGRDDWHGRGGKIRALHREEMIRRNEADFSYPGFPEHSQTKEIDFSAVDFPNPVGAEGLVFFPNAVFESAAFNREAWFDYATFSKAALFDSATFRGAALFGSAMFNGRALFRSATFNWYAGFGSATFSGEARFDTTTFSGVAFFGSATFNGHAEFGSTKFNGQAIFGSTTFHRQAVFASATFFGAAMFGSAAFTEVAQFDSATFSGAALFGSATFNGFTYFPEVQFGAPDQSHPVTFTDCQFLKPTYFRNAVFHSQYPDLSGTVLHDKTEFTSKPENWPLSTAQPAEDAKAACARIRHAIAKQGLPEEEHFFYRREMGFACRIGPLWQRLPYQIFGLLSDFGYSIQRPIEAISVLWLWPAVFFFGHAQTGRLADYPLIGRALALSFANIFNFLGFHRTFFASDYLPGLPVALQLLSGFQMLAGLVLLFFLGLGLRTRFRLR